MYLEVTYFGDEKTLFYLEKVILWLYNFTWGFYSQKTEISYFNIVCDNFIFQKNKKIFLGKVKTLSFS